MKLLSGGVSKKRLVLSGVVAWLILVGILHTTKALPEGLDVAGPVHVVNTNQITFFADRTYIQNGERVSEQEIFGEIFRMIDDAESYVLIDMFFYSDFLGVETEADRYLAHELTERLITKKANEPEIVIQVITDPINIMYGGHRSDDFAALEEAGVSLIVTELESLRDSNPVYSAVWRTFFQWFGNSDEPGYLPNPLDQKSQKLGLRTYLKMLNYKANHRKVVVTDFVSDKRTELATLITSANPHDGSSAHSNIAVRINGDFAYDVIASEAAVAALSGSPFVWPAETEALAVPVAVETAGVQLLTEESIEATVVDAIDATAAGDQIDLAMFYIADREVVRALKAADEQGVNIRVLLDPNKDAFGREKNGVPNRQVAHELMSHTEGNTEVRWCNTNGEQCHSKLLLVTRGDTIEFIQGSANYTRRNLDNYNLETNVAVVGSSELEVISNAQAFFEEQWSNKDGIEYSLAYGAYEDSSIWRTISYRFKEFTGLSRW